MRAVPRDAFLPGIELENAYTDQAMTIKDNPGKPLPLSCASVPSVVAMMLGQLDARVGDSVLEIGAGTGYNAALLAELIDHGQVTTVDIDSDVALHARTTPNATGYEHVTVIERDGLLGAAKSAPYDKIIATVGVWDIPTTWWEQLKDGGRLVLPPRWRGQTRSVALTRRGGELVSEGMELCGFVPIIGQNGERTSPLDADDTIRVHYDQDQHVDTDALAAIPQGTFRPPSESEERNRSMGSGCEPRPAMTACAGWKSPRRPWNKNWSAGPPLPAAAPSWSRATPWPT